MAAAKVREEQVRDGSEEVRDALARLQAGACDGGCGGFVAGLAPLARRELFTALVFDRLKRKMHRVEALYREAGENWNQTFYLLYFRTLSDLRNQETYLRLARLVPYKVVLRERQTPQAVEALLLGAAGLLDLCEPDDYTFGLRRTFEHLAAKYEIVPMQADEWTLQGLRPANHPLLRLAQAAAFFTQDEFVMARTMACRSEADVRRLFCIDAPEYWRSRSFPGAGSDGRPRRLGTFKAHIIGINLVAILQFAYGSYTGRESLRDNALSLLESLQAEENRFISAWRARGLRPADAFDTQALLQLSTEFCAPASGEPRCALCPVGRRILQSLGEPRP
ncbi:MAG: DUF2851 family protein [Alistipes sp.]|nr:DUF2851 family protein [Alistipes senegalensis]MCM1250877.1 DUF2851 family protein [Alistipes sp.]